MDISKIDLYIKNLMRTTSLNYKQISYKTDKTEDYVRNLDTRIRGYRGSLIYTKIIYDLINSPLSRNALAKKYDVDINLIETINRTNGIRKSKIRMGTKYAEKLNKQIIELLKRQYTIEQIRDEIGGVSRAYITKLRNTTKYVTYKEEKVIDLLMQGVPINKITAELGCSNSTVSNIKYKFKIKRGKRGWKQQEI